MPFKPMLSATVKALADVPFPVFVSPKLDGIRAMVIDGVLVSRNLKPIPNAHCQDLYGHDYFNGLDGELIFGKPTGNDVWARSQSGVMSRSGKPGVTFHVFDCFLPHVVGRSFQRRQMEIVQVLKSSPRAPTKIVEQHMAANAKQLSKIESGFINEGYEGAMLRKMAGPSPYKFGRSTMREGLLMKLVRKHTMEGVVVGLVEQMHNGNEATKDALGRTKRSKVKAGLTGKGTLGALVLTKPGTGKEPVIDTFEVGTGFDDKTRAELWAMGRKLHGRVVKIEYRELTPDGQPRFPVYLGLRDARDMDARK